MHPLARRTDVLEQPLGRAAVLFDIRSGRAHALDEVAALVFRNANGERSVAQLAELTSSSLNLPDAEAHVEMTLHRLAAATLLDGGFVPRGARHRAVRRTVLRRVGIAARAAVASTFGLAVPQADGGDEGPDGGRLLGRSASGAARGA